MDNLKPCPFCGGEAEIKEYNDGSGGVNCTQCKFEPLTHAAYHRQKDRPRAIKEWNLRVPDINIPTDRMQEICEAEQEGRLMILPDMPQDMDNLLEPLKLQCALNSELRKLEFRKKERPKDVNILDYTIIAALQKCLEAAELASKAGVTHGKV